MAFGMDRLLLAMESEGLLKENNEYIHLYINGEYDHIKWPDSGDNPKIIKIQHVAQQVAN